MGIVYRKIALTERATDRFHASYRKGEPGECWPWTGHITNNGYGRFKAGRDYQITASRVAWYLANDRQPEGCVCHSCDNPVCVNPNHLWLGTHKDNIADMIAKGRRYLSRGIVSSPTHCPNGHERTPENTFPSDSKPGRQKRCRTCHLIRSRAHKARQRSAA